MHFGLFLWARAKMLQKSQDLPLRIYWVGPEILTLRSSPAQLDGAPLISTTKAPSHLTGEFEATSPRPGQLGEKTAPIVHRSKMPLISPRLKTAALAFVRCAPINSSNNGRFSTRSLWMPKNFVENRNSLFLCKNLGGCVLNYKWI